MRKRTDANDIAGSGLKGLAMLAVVVLAIVAIAMVVPDSDDHSYSNDGGDGDGDRHSVYDVSDNREILIDDSDAIQGVATRTTDGKVEVTATLSDSAASGFSVFKWYVIEVGSSTYTGYKEKSEPHATWTLDDDTTGTYTFGVVCEKDSGWGFHPGGFGWTLPSSDSESYSMIVTVNMTGTVTKSYEWSYDGVTHNATVVYDYSEYQKYSGISAASYSKRSAFASITDFIVVDDVVKKLSSDLSCDYTATCGASAEGQGFAEFVLAFVQEAYSYLEDASVYSREEYYAFPLETIQHGGGDCEDTSILYAAIMTASGYEAGVFLIPGHCIAAVSLDAYSPGEVDARYTGSVAQFSYKDSDGRTYYGCETTLDENAYGIGWISDMYSIDADGEITYTTTDAWGRKTTSTGNAYGTYKSQGYGLHRAASA